MNSPNPSRTVETIHATDEGFLGANADVVRFGYGPAGVRMFRDFPRAMVDLEAYVSAIAAEPEGFEAACEVAVCEGKVTP